MNIFLIILGTLLSYVGCIGIAIKGSFDMMMIFPKKGFIINLDKLEEEKSKLNNVSVSAKSSILLLIPFVNMIYTAWLMNDAANKVFNECKNQSNLLIAMSDEEKKEFKNRKKYLLKLDYYMKLMAEVSKSDVVDTETYEIVDSKSDTQEEVKENKVIDEYRKLRDEVNSLNSCEDNLEDSDDFSLKRKF